MEYLSPPKKLIIPEYKLNRDSQNYGKEARAVLQQFKNFFPQFSFFANKIQESFYEILYSCNRKKAILANYITYKSTDFQAIPKDENETLKFIDYMKQFAQTPKILDILLKFNYIYDSFPSLTPNLDNLLLSISMQNENPLIKLVLISQLFSMPSRIVYDKVNEFESINIDYPGEIISCDFDQKNQEILPLTVTNPKFPINEDSLYLRYYKHDYVFSPLTKTVNFSQIGPKKRISTKSFCEFLTNCDEKVVEIGVCNDQLCFVQQLFENSNSKLRITLFKKGILIHDIIKKENIIELDSEFDMCKIFQNNLMIFMKNGKKYIYNIEKRILNKDPIPSQLYFDYNKCSVYDKINEVFILPNIDDDKLIYQIIKREKKKSKFVQIIPPFYGVQTDEIISRVSFELMNLCTEVLSVLMESKASISTNLVSDPLLHIQYALDLSETIQKNEFNHDQNLCDYCLIALARFIIINIYQLNVNGQNLADFQIQKITRLFGSIKMTVPYFDTLFALVSIIDHGIYTKSFISKVLHPFIPLIDSKKILQVPSFVLFIKPENISSMRIKEKMTFLQNKVKDFINIYKTGNLDQELIPFITTYLETLQEALNTKSVSSTSIYSYFSSLIPFLCIMENTPQLSSVILTYLTQNLNKLFVRINHIIEKIDIFFSRDDDFNHFLETQTTEIRFSRNWLSYHYVEFPGLEYDEIKYSNEFPNESFKFFNEFTKDDLLIYLLPNAIVNCIQICYKSIEITQDEKDNKCYFSYSCKQDNSESLNNITVSPQQEELNFLLQLNEKSMLINRLRNEVKNFSQRNLPKEIKKVEILIFKSLLFQSHLVKCAMDVNEKSQINPQIKSIWRTAIKVRTDLRLAKQFEANKKEVHVNLKERYEDYIKSIKDKCAFLLNQKSIDENIDIDDWIKQNYSFITSNLPLSKLFTLQETIKKRKEISKLSLMAISKILKAKMPKSFMRSFISCLAENKTLNKVLNEDDEIYSFLVNSNDPFIRLCTFDFIETDNFYETALKLLDYEDNLKVRKFLKALTNTTKDEIDIDNLLKMIGKNQYDIEHKNPINIQNCIKKVAKKASLESLISKLNGFDDISLGVLAVINSFQLTFESKDINTLYPILIKLQIQLPNEINNLKDKVILNLYVQSLMLIIKFDYFLFKIQILPQVDLSRFENLIIFKSLINVDISDLFELYHEMKENQPKSIDENPHFIQLKGNSLSMLSSNKISSLKSDYNYYVFNKPIENNEKISFNINYSDFYRKDCSYLLLGALNINDDFIGFIPDYTEINKNIYMFNDNYYKITDSIHVNLMKDPEKKQYTFYIENDLTKKCYSFASKKFITGPIIPFILIFSAELTITYDYYSNFEYDESFSFCELVNISTESISNLNELMTIIPPNIVGNKIHIHNIGNGVIIKTNEINDNVEIALFNEDGVASLANINLPSTKCNIVKESNFIKLLRSLIISDGFYDEKFMENYILPSQSMLLYESLLIYSCFSFSTACIQFALGDKNLMSIITTKYKNEFSSLIEYNCNEIVEIFSKDINILIDLVKYDLINDPLHYIVSVSNKFDYIKSFLIYLKYKKIQYKESDIDKIKFVFESICSDKLIHLLDNYIVTSLFNDLLSFLIDYSYDIVISKLNYIDDEKINKFLGNYCNKPDGIPTLIGLIYDSYVPENEYIIEANHKFVLSLKCKNIENDEILNINTEYEFDHEIKLKVIKPEIHNFLEVIKQYNHKKHINTFLKLFHEQNNLITLSIENLADENVNSDILYLYLILFNRLQCIDNNIFVLKTVKEKLMWLRDELDCFPGSTLTLHLTRFQKMHQKSLIFDQFYNIVEHCYYILRNTAPFSVIFVGEGGIDQGGLRREAITLIYEELTDLKNGFFEQQEDGYFVPSKNCDMNRLEVIGAFIACCFYSGNPRDFNLSPKIWSFFISSSELLDEITNEAVIALKKGFNTIIPEYNIRLFTGDDIRKLSCGDCFSFDRFINCCKFYNNNINDVFTQAVSKFSQIELVKLLQFITGSQTIPFDSSFKIEISFKSSEGDDESKWSLPVAHTCFCSVDICPFTNPDILADKLRMAMVTEMISDGTANYGILYFD